ncbi:LlaJI family restriction endonuclease [Qipengyuania aquimaris]|uniref:LlaJI family restriction endonuclease n=1 Tax=Qipengyuania aquimaris TaxID=255984 RepID=UPI001FD5AF28|nr:LlaJI family restriction endonuclease [Qipengyuania aquimaris]UOR15830.1 LlaJI family restriction endonuclease [Qipengyuania aquimaris]
MSVDYLPDRISKAELERSNPEVTKALMSRWPAMMENGHETVAWVGIAKASGSDTVFFLPHGAPSGEAAQAELAGKLMRAIVRFSAENRRDGESRERDSTTLAALLAALAKDFRDCGLYSTREMLNSTREGKPDWARTVKTQTAFPASNGSPVYCEISSIRYSSLATNTVARIQEQVIAEIDRTHGWWLSPYFGNREIPRPPLLAEWPREHWARLLKQARRSLYERRALNLVSMLLAYLDHSAETGTGDVYCGISDFSRLWEVMLRETIPNVDRGWNNRLPVPAYFRAGDGPERIQGMETDIVAGCGEFTVILDAKYYRATSTGYSPRVQDISKQFVYQKAVEATGKATPDRVINAFVFPAKKTGREPFEKIEFLLPDNSVASGFAPVLCQYICVSDVVDAYINRQKLKNQAWLPALCA